MAKYTLIILWLMIVSVCIKGKRQLLILMIDGARWDYMEQLDEEQLHGFRYFKEKGIRVEYVEGIYPSVSYPGWTTLSTGLYPENHGIIGNIMYDKEHDEHFDLHKSNTKLPLWWQDVEPIWTTATRAGLKVATLDWSRSDVPVRGVLPLIATGHKGYTNDITGKLQDAFSLIKNGFHLVMVHYDDVDLAGHGSGPNSNKVILAMIKVGTALQTLINQLVSGGFIENVDIIIVSDHGMTSTCNYPKIKISNIIDIKRDTVKVIYDLTMVGIFAKPGSELHVSNKLKSVRDYQVKRRSEITDRFHYKHSRRAPDILMYAKYKKQKGCHRQNGTHGFDPAVPDMRAMFLAFGKSFKGEGLVHKPINMVDIYQIYCHILGIEPEPHNGSWNNVKSMMASSQDDPQQWQDYLEERRAFTLQWDKSFSKDVALRYINVLKTRPPLMYIAFLSFFMCIFLFFKLKLK